MPANPIGSRATVTPFGTIAAAGDLVTLTIGGLAFAYTAIAGDVGSWNVASLARVVAYYNAQPTFSALYVITQMTPAPGWYWEIASLSPSNNVVPIVIAYTGAGSCTFSVGTVIGPTNPAQGQLAGGGGGAYAVLQSTGGAVTPTAGVTQPTVGGFITQIGTTFTKGGIG